MMLKDKQPKMLEKLQALNLIDNLDRSKHVLESDDKLKETEALNKTLEHLDVIKKACHVQDKRKTFDIHRSEIRTLKSFDRFSIEDVPSYVLKLFHKTNQTTFDSNKIPSFSAKSG